MFGGFEATCTDFGCKTILKVTIPKGMYSEDETKKIRKIIREQVDNEFLVVIVPEGVTLEIVE